MNRIWIGLAAAVAVIAAVAGTTLGIATLAGVTSKEDEPKPAEGVESEPSFYKKFVFIMPLPEIDQLLGGTSVRIAPQEMVAHGDTGGAETDALYVTPEELQDSAFMLEQLLMAVGFKDVPY